MKSLLYVAILVRLSPTSLKILANIEVFWILLSSQSLTTLNLARFFSNNVVSGSFPSDSRDILIPPCYPKLELIYFCYLILFPFDTLSFIFVFKWSTYSIYLLLVIISSLPYISIFYVELLFLSCFVSLLFVKLDNFCFSC